VEDKIYRKQVFKGGLSRTGTEEGEQFRYFSAAELRDLFRLDPLEARTSSTQRHLHALHANQRVATVQLQEHLEFLKTLDGFTGISDHDLLYSSKETGGTQTAKTGATTAAPVGFTTRPSTTGGGSTSARKGKASGHGAGGGRSVGGKSGSQVHHQGWSGGDGDISAMFAKALTLGTGGELARSRNTISAAEIENVSHREECKARISSIEAQLAKQQGLLCNPVLVSGLADGGSKIRARIVELNAELDNVRLAQASRSAPSVELAPAASQPACSNTSEIVYDDAPALALDEPTTETPCVGARTPSPDEALIAPARPSLPAPLLPTVAVERRPPAPTYID